MKKIVLIAGYTSISNLKTIKECFSLEDTTFACAYSRPPKTETKERYLKGFDILFNLQQPADIDRLQHASSDILLITCTQERDMEVYITTLVLCGKITKDQETLYSTVINKEAFKKELLSSQPDLVPNVQIINEELLSNLDSLSYPQVIKPSGLAGSILIKIVHNADEFKKHFDSFASQMKSIGSENYEKEIEVITEEYISGPQYSVNVYIDKDQHITFCPISRIVTPQELGSDDSYSALQYVTDEIGGDTYEALKNAVRSVVTHFNIRNTSAHFDSVLHESGWKFFEVGLRIGGKRQDLYQMSHGMNHLENDVLNRIGKKISIPEQKKSVCIIQKASEKSGVLKNITYTRTIDRENPPLLQEDKMAKIGDYVMPLSEGGGTIARFFMQSADHSVVEDSKTLFNSIKFKIEKQ